MTLTYESYSFRNRQMRLQKRPTRLLTTLGRTVGTTWESVQGKELPVGTKVEIRGTLYWIDASGAYQMVEAGKSVKVYIRPPGESYSLLTTRPTDANSSFYSPFTLVVPGVFSFYCEFAGDDIYEGCSG